MSVGNGKQWNVKYGSRMRSFSCDLVCRKHTSNFYRVFDKSIIDNASEQLAANSYVKLIL